MKTNWPDADLFSVPIDSYKTEKQCKQKGIKRKTGYPKPPGSGPSGHTCRDCGFKRRIQSRSGKAWYKCLQNKHAWAGPATDIKLRSPACSLWMPLIIRRKCVDYRY